MTKTIKEIDYIFALVPKEPRFSEHVLDRASSICSDIAQVILASVAVPTLFGELKPVFIIPGTLLTLVFWTFSLLIVKLTP